MGCGGIQPRETDCVGRAWCGRGLRDRHPSTTRPTARSLPLGARATGRQGGASTPSRSHSPRTSSARLVDRTATGTTRPSPSAESHSVTSPRWTKACSYADQFPTRYFVLYFGWTFDLMSRSCTRSGHRGQRAYSCLVAAEGLCTNAQPRCHRSRGRTYTDRLPDQQRMVQAPIAEIGTDMTRWPSRLGRASDLVNRTNCRFDKVDRLFN